MVSKMSSALLCQVKGCGPWFQCAAQRSMASLSSATEVNARFDYRVP